MTDPEPPTLEELAAAGIYDPDDDHAAERLELIEYLLGLGATVEELADAAPNLPMVASTRALWGPGERFTHAEAAARAGMKPEVAARIWRATGFPDPGPDARIFSDEDVEVLRTFQAGAELLGEEVVLQVGRVIGSSMARVADATIAAFLVNIAGPSLLRDPGGLTLARANAEGIALLREASKSMDVIFRRHVERLQRPLTAGDQRTQVCAVGFADLVDSTALAQRVSFAELGSVLSEFDELASDIVVDAGARVVKLIGDSVMYVTGDPAAACQIAVTLADQLSDHPRLPPVRVGLAYGDVLTRDGDHFGPVVNLASRVVKLAEPSGVIASAPLCRAVDGYHFAPFGTCDLKGFDESIELFEVRRL